VKLREPRRSQLLLGLWAAAVFGLSALTSLRWLALATLLAGVALRAGALPAARRVLRSVVPVTVALSLASAGWLRLVSGRWPDAAPFVALALRAALIAFVTFSTLARIDLFRALAPFPIASRLLVLTLAQVHALRLVATDSLLGLRSRLLRRPGPVDVVRGAGGITGALLTISMKNARDVSDAMRSRGF
jgi:cobalt/nickel transport system permease protein